MANNTESRTIFVDGDMLFRLLHERGIEELELAKRTGLSGQTIRNYLGSTTHAPWRAAEKMLARVSKCLNVETQELRLKMPNGTRPTNSLAFGLEFFGCHPKGPVDTGRVLDISGRWQARVWLTGDEAEVAGWSNKYAVTIKQTDAGFWAEWTLEHKNGSASSVLPLHCHIMGHSMESGNYLASQYHFQSDAVRLYGFALMRYRGDRITGSFVGRNTRLGADVLEGRIECCRCGD